jgi:hypothetical protein
MGALGQRSAAIGRGEFTLPRLVSDKPDDMRATFADGQAKRASTYVPVLDVEKIDRT